jgi:hypothetical protein
MAEAVLDERHPGQKRSDNQKAGGDQFDEARTRRDRIIGAVMIVVIVVVMAVPMAMIVLGMRVMIVVAVMMIVPAPAAHGDEFGATRPEAAEKRYRAADNGAEQRQEDNRVIHSGSFSPSSC